MLAVNRKPGFQPNPDNYCRRRELPGRSLQTLDIAALLL